MYRIGLVVAVVLMVGAVCFTAGCGGGEQAQRDASAARSVEFLGVDTDTGADKTLPAGAFVDAAISPAANLLPAAYYPDITPPAGESGFARYYAYDLPYPNRMRLRFMTGTNRVYLVEVSLREWRDDPDLYIGRNSDVSADAGRHWMKSIQTHPRPDAIVFRSNANQWMYVAVVAYWGGPDGICRFRIRVGDCGYFENATG